MKKKIMEPKIPMFLQERKLSDVLESEWIENSLFKNEVITEGYFDKLEFSSCRFEKVTLDFKVDKMDLLDVVFEHCDLSNIQFIGRSIHRVHFINCKLVGVNFTNSSLEDVLFENCNLLYSSFSDTNCRNVKFSNCNLSVSNFHNVIWNNLLFDQCQFERAEFFHTSLQNIDFTSCDIHGICLDTSNLKGMIVTSLQALLLSQLLGIVIDDTK